MPNFIAVKQCNLIMLHLLDRDIDIKRHKISPETKSQLFVSFETQLTTTCYSKILCNNTLLLLPKITHV